MKLLSKLAICAFGVICATSVAAKTTLVFPGAGTLKAAITDAVNGDTLILRGGVYFEDSEFYVTKSITIRSESLANKASIAFKQGYEFYVGDNTYSSCGLRISLIGLKFSGTSIYESGCYNEFNLIQSEFSSSATLSVGHTNYANDQPTTIKRIIGNDFNITNIYVSAGHIVYVAGNSISGKLQAGGADNVYVVGNRITTPSSYYVVSNSAIDETGPALDVNANKKAYVIANDMNLNLYKSKSYDANFEYTSAVRVYGKFANIANNHINYNVVGDSSIDWQFGAEKLTGILTDAGFTEITNNLLEFPDGLMEMEEASGGIVFSTNVHGIAYNNVVINMPVSAIYSATPEFIDVANNICFQNGTDCGTENGNLSVDPLLDVTTYEPLNNSPAINAGRNVFRFYDIDGTIGDIGLYGGPYGYEQFQSQIDATDEPYVYPIFHGIAPVDAENVSVQVMAVARMK